MIQWTIKSNFKSKSYQKGFAILSSDSKFFMNWLDRIERSYFPSISHLNIHINVFIERATPFLLIKAQLFCVVAKFDVYLKVVFSRVIFY